MSWELGASDFLTAKSIHRLAKGIDLLATRYSLLFWQPLRARSYVKGREPTHYSLPATHYCFVPTKHTEYTKVGVELADHTEECEPRPFHRERSVVK